MSPMMSTARATSSLQHLGVEGRLLARGIGVEVPAHILDLARRWPPLSRRRAVPLKAMCSRKWLDAVDSSGALVPRASGDIGADR
jgi:hypothetical protein